MKKIYVSPLTRVKELESIDMLVSSPGFFKESEETVTNRDVLGRENNKDNNRNPSIWDQGW